MQQQDATTFPHVIRLVRDRVLVCRHCGEDLEISPRVWMCPEESFRFLEFFAMDHGGCVQYAGQLEKARSHRRFVHGMRRAMQ